MEKPVKKFYLAVGKQLWRHGDRYIITAYSTWRGGGWRLDLLQPEGMSYKEYRLLCRTKSGLYSPDTIFKCFTEENTWNSK